MKSVGQILYEIGMVELEKRLGFKSPPWDKLGMAYKELYEAMARDFLNRISNGNPSIYVEGMPEKR